MVSSTRWRRTRAPRSSTENHTTRWPALMAWWPRASVRWLLPVLEGPQTTMLSWRPTHSRLLKACWVAGVIEERAACQVSKVLPAGSWAALRRASVVEASGPSTSARSSTRSSSAGSQRCAFRGEQHFGGLLADVAEAEPTAEALELGENAVGGHPRRLSRVALLVVGVGGLAAGAGRGETERGPAAGAGL